MSTPSHTDDIDYANASTSTAAASTTTISDGRTKHRAVGADDDDAPFVGAGAELSVVDDAAATSNGSSSGGKRKQAPGMICVVIFMFLLALLGFFSHFFFFFFAVDVAATASTFSALPTIESLNAEKAKLDAEKKKLEDKLEAGVSETLEVVIRQQITGIDARITGIDNNIAEVLKQITASISASSKPARATDVQMPPGTTCGIVFLFSDLLLPQSTWACSRSSSGSSSSLSSTRLSPCR